MVLGTNGGGVPVEEAVTWFEENQEMLVGYGIKVLGVIAVMIIALILSGIISGLVSKALNKAKVDKTLGRFLGKMIRWLVLLLAGLGCLGMFGVDVTSFAAILAAAGFAIGMAFQGSLSNLAAGVMLLVFRPFKVDDVVNAAGQTGKIFEIGLFTVSMDTPDNRRIIIPNSAVFGSTIENISYHDTRRVDVAVGCDYSASLDQTREVLTAAAASVDGQVKEGAIVLAELGASSVDWVVRIWVPASDFFPKKEALTNAIKVHLDNAGIGIPFPQMDIHMDKVE